MLIRLRQIVFTTYQFHRMGATLSQLFNEFIRLSRNQDYLAEWYNDLTTSSIEKATMNKSLCSCNNLDLLNHGCTCRKHKTRTLPINILVAELGFKRARAVIEAGMSEVDVVVRNKMVKPTGIDDLISLMWEIETYNISLHDDIARALESEFKSPSSLNEHSTSNSWSL